MLWHIGPKFCIWLCITLLHSSLSFVNLRQFLWELCPFWNLEYCKYTVIRTFLWHAVTYGVEILHMTLFYCTTDQVRVSSICVNFCGSYAPFGTWNTGNTPFSFFSLTCFEILSWKFAYEFVLMYYRSSSSVINLPHFLSELRPFWNLEYWKYTVFRIFLTYMLWHIGAEILHMTLFLLYYRSGSSVINLRQFLSELCPFWNLEYWKYTVFRIFFFLTYMLWHIELKFCIWLCFTVLQIKFECHQFASICVGFMPLLEIRILENTAFRIFLTYMLWHIELKFCIWLCFTVLQIEFECHQFASILWELYPFWNLEYQKYTVFRIFLTYMLRHIALKLCIWLCFTVLQIKFECHQFASIFVRVMPLFGT